MANPFDQFDEPQPQQMPQPQANPFDEFDAPQPQPQPMQQEASGVFDAFSAGYQGSATGLFFRGKLPDIVLSPTDADWYERLASGVGTIVSELPIGIVGAIGGGVAGGAAGTAVPVVGNVAGGVVGAGAGSMALPAAIRESYIQAYTKGEIESSADFLNRVGLVLKQTAKEGLIGGLTAGAGRAATLTAQTAGAGAKTTLAAGLTAEGATLVVAPAALEGRLPEPQEFMDAAILLLGFKGATVGGAQLVKGAAKLAEIYRRTGKTPIEVMADAQRDPTIAEDLAAAKPETPTAKPDLPKESPYVETRGGNERFHGTSKPIDQIARGDMLYDSRNIYGQGFYTTDAVDVSIGYTKKDKGGQPTLYRVIVQNNPRLYDMEAPLTDSVRAIAERAFRDLYPDETADGKPIANLREMYDEVRAQSKYEGYTREGVQEMFDEMIVEMQQLGYDGFSHIGGLRTKNPEHAVQIFWSPEKHVRLEQVGFDAYKKPETPSPKNITSDTETPPDAASPINVYHGTKAQGVGIEQLSDSADLGPHFTVNRKTAEIFANDKGTSGTVLEGTARFSKSLELPDLATWFPTEVAQAIDNVRGVKPQADGQTPFQAKVWRAMEDARIAAVDSGASAADASAASNAAGYKVIRDALKADGYDSIKYTNKFEGEPADTYIALDISKVKAKATPTPETPSDAPEIPRAYQEQARQENARNAVPPPSKQSAEFIEKPFAEVPQLPGEPVLKTHVNYNYLNTTDDVKGAMSRLSELYEDNIRTATRDKVSWEQTYAEAREIYRISTGEEPPPTPLANADYAKLAADLYARKQLLTSGAEQLINLRNEYVKARAENRATDQMRLEILAQVDRIGKAQAEVRGAQAEVGRALNILKSTNRDKAYYDELNEVLNQRFKTGDNLADTANRPTFDNIMDMLGQYENPSQVLKFASKATKPNWLDKFMEVYTAGLVSGVVTQTANIFGSAAMLPLRPLVDAAAVGFGAFRKEGERVAAVEPLARVAGTVLGTVDAARIAGAVARSGVPYKMTPDQVRNAISGKVGEIVRLPYRGLATADAFFRVLNERAEAYTLAARQAAKEGLNPATREFRERVAQIAADPPEAMAEKIEAAGLRFTFASPVGSLGQTLLTARRKSPLLTFIIPFVQTPINAVKEMLRYSPLSPAVKEWRDDIAKGGVARDKAIAEVSVGVAMGATVMALAAADNLSGNGPVEPEKRRVLLASGWQPYSIKVGDKWYSYQRIQPLGGLLGMYADTQEIWEQMTEEEQRNAMAAIGAAFANAITNQTFLQGVTNFIEAFDQPERFMPRYIENQAASFVPGILGQTAPLIDPYRREVYSIFDAVTNRIPLASQTLLPQRDVFGEAIENKDRVGIVGPVTVTTESEDKVRVEAARLGLGVGVTKKYIELKDLGEDDLGRVNLTPEQRDVLAEQSGKMAYTILDQLVNSPGWDDMPDLIKRQTMERVFEDARKYGRAMAVPPEQLLQEYERINEGLGKRLQPK